MAVYKERDDPQLRRAGAENVAEAQCRDDLGYAIYQRVGGIGNAGDCGRELPYEDLLSQPGDEPRSLPRGVSFERHGTGPDRRPCSTGPNADSESPDIKESAVERRFGIALDGNQQRPRQS